MAAPRDAAPLVRQGQRPPAQFEGTRRPIGRLEAHRDRLRRPVVQDRAACPFEPGLIGGVDEAASG